MRFLALAFGIALFTVGCSSSPDGNHGNGGSGGTGGGVGGTGGSGGTGGAGGSGGSGGSGGASGGDMAMGPDMAQVLDRDPTAHPSPIDIPQTTTSGTLSNAEVYVVVWSDPANANDDQTMGQQLVAFYTWMLGSDYYTQWGAEYGIKAGTAKNLLVIPEAPPAILNENSSLFSNNSDFVKALTKYIGTTGWPAAADIDSNTVFAFFTDPKTSVQQKNPLTGQVAASCTAFGGYHITGPIASKTVPYIVVARCPDQPNGPTEWQQDTVAASHELAETAADPSANGLNSGDRTIIAGGGEVGDICIEENITLTDGTNPYVVQRLWSESAWKAGNVDPCVPADGPWFGAAIVNSDASTPAYNITVHVDATGKGSADFSMQPFSYDPTITSLRFELAASLIPAGLTLTPNIARTATSGVLGTGAPGTTFKVHIDAVGAKTGKTGIVGFAVSGTGATERVTNWWGDIQIVSP
jgi:hypothetical protein